jgi:hypothetical protein
MKSSKKVLAAGALATVCLASVPLVGRLQAMDGGQIVARQLGLCFSHDIGCDGLKADVEKCVTQLRLIVPGEEKISVSRLKPSFFGVPVIATASLSDGRDIAKVNLTSRDCLNVVPIRH